MIHQKNKPTMGKIGVDRSEELKNNWRENNLENWKRKKLKQKQTALLSLRPHVTMASIRNVVSKCSRWYSAVSVGKETLEYEDLAQSNEYDDQRLGDRPPGHVEVERLC